MRPFRPLAFLPILLLALLPAHSYGEQAHSADFVSAQQKFAWIAANGQSSDPSTRPTVITAGEWNAYLNEGGVKLPQGVTGVRILSTPGFAHCDAEVDFDSLTANHSRQNPLLALFTGKHQVTATARVDAIDGVGAVHVESVWFDGVEIPHIALQYFANRYLQPRYGNAIGMDSTFHLHYRIDTAVAGDNKLTITQR